MKDPNASLPVMSASHLSVGYAGHAPTLSDIGFELRPSALTVMLGENGSGKSTLIRTLSGAQAPLSGNVMLGERPVVSYSLRQRSRLLGMVYTDRAVAGGLTVRETVAIGRQPYTGLFGRLSDSDRLIVDEAMRLAGIEHKAPRYLSDLSDGERQKAMIARVLSRRASPDTFQNNSVDDNRDYGGLLRRVLDDVNTGGINVILTPGRYNSAFFEHSYLAERTKAVFAMPQDLFVEGNVGDPHLGNHCRYSCKSVSIHNYPTKLVKISDMGLTWRERG